MKHTLSIFSRTVTAAVKAEMARRNVIGTALAEALGRNRNYLYERLRFEKPFNTEDISEIACYLDISPLVLLAAPTSSDEKYPLVSGKAER